jgi:hypothetical protein
MTLLETVASVGVVGIMAAVGVPLVQNATFPRSARAAAVAPPVRARRLCARQRHALDAGALRWTRRISSLSFSEPFFAPLNGRPASAR